VLFTWQELVDTAMPEGIQCPHDEYGETWRLGTYFYIPETASLPAAFISVTELDGQVYVDIRKTFAEDLAMAVSCRDGVLYNSTGRFNEIYVYKGSFPDTHFTGKVEYRYKDDTVFHGDFVDGNYLTWTTKPPLLHC
jgi:hypothetical protein